MKKIKEEDLILYLYKECTSKMKAAIEAALEEDIELQDKLRVLKRTLKQLEKLKAKSPSRQSIKNILQHAEKATRKK